MLQLALVFLVLALIAAVLGFGGLTGALSVAAQCAFVVFLTLFLVSLLAGAVRGDRP